MAMQVVCTKCEAQNEVPSDDSNRSYQCYNCGAFLPKPQDAPGETSAAVGMIGGAALGAAIGGPPGALIGAILGAIIGKEAKGVG